jgi:hypothetical protein
VARLTVFGAGDKKMDFVTMTKKLAKRRGGRQVPEYFRRSTPYAVSLDGASLYRLSDPEGP